MDEPIRILNLFTIMDRGGAETMVMNYYRSIDRSKVQFDFMVHRQERGAYDDEIERLGGRIFRMCPIYPQNFGKYQKMVKAFFDAHPEYRIVHSHMSELGFFALREAKRHGVPTRICHAHNAPVGFDVKLLMRDYFKLRIRPYVTHRFICGESSGDWLFGKRYRSAFIRMNNAIDAAKFRCNAQTALEARQALGIAADATVIGHVGRFNTQKNHTFLIEIFEQIRKREPGSVLVLVGGGNLEEKIRRQVAQAKLEDSVIFTGVRDDIPRLMQAFDVFLFPSLFEGLPVTLVEAQAAGLPCLTSKDVVISDTDITGRVTFYPLQESAASWAEKTLSLAKLPREDTFEKIKAGGFDVHANAAWLQSFYTEEYQKNL